jgi:hypothetical protein
MHEHKQVAVRYRGETVTVDEGLVRLLDLIWRHGIGTDNSCQENRPGIAWIQFPSADDAKRFLNLVSVYPDSGIPRYLTLYGRIAGDCDGPCRWTFDALPVNCGVRSLLCGNESVDTFSGANAFEFLISIRFPVEDISLLVQELESRLPSD